MRDFLARAWKMLREFLCHAIPRGFRARWYYILVVAGVVGVDQLTKWLVVSHMSLYESIRVIPGIFHFTYITNDGAAWGMLDQHRWVFMVLSTVGILALLLYLFGKKGGNVWLDLGLAFVIGGGIGNMIDRLATGEVVDFLNAVFLDAIGGFPIFNGADCFVCIGAGVLLVVMACQIIREIRDEKSGKKDGQDETDGRE